MSRPIRFRAWDTEKQKWATRTGNGFIKAYKWDTIIEVEQEGLEFQQFTGLRDKNGKEIYEGDVVRLFEGRKNERIDVVEWEENSAKFVKSQSPGSDMFGGEGIEVISNIYETPELLKQETNEK